MSQHTSRESGNCKMVFVECPYSMVGCGDMTSRGNIADHENVYLMKHTKMLLEYVVQEIKSAKKSLDNMQESIKKNIDTQNATLEKLDKKCNEQCQTVRDNTLAIEKLQKSLKCVLDKDNIYDKKISTCEAIMGVIGQENQKLDNRINLLTNTSGYDERTAALERKIKAQDRIIALKDVALAEQDLRLQALELTSYDGVLTWKIDKFAQKKNDAVTGKTTSIYSPCFYSSRFGYKLCLRVYLNGDGMGKGNHISLFFAVMRGRYDQMLRWPFRLKVTLMWLDQSNVEHVIDAFRPDPASASFGQPKQDMNIASGCPLFMPLTQLDNPRRSYVKNDVAFVRVLVDNTDGFT